MKCMGGGMRSNMKCMGWSMYRDVWGVWGEYV